MPHKCIQNLWGGFPWFKVHEDRQGAYLLSKFSFWLLFSLDKSIILVIGESPTTVFGLLSSSLLLFPQRFGRYVRYEEGRRTYRPKRSGNNKDEDNSPKTFNDKKQGMVFLIFLKISPLNFKSTSSI